MTYLATPYSHPDPSVRHERFIAACRIAGKLMAQGEIVFSPIAHTHPIAVECDLPKGWEYWERFDREFIAAAAKLIVAKMDGWQESKGVRAEIELAQAAGIPVEYIEP